MFVLSYAMNIVTSRAHHSKNIHVKLGEPFIIVFFTCGCGFRVVGIIVGLGLISNNHSEPIATIATSSSSAMDGGWRGNIFSLNFSC